MVKIKWQKNAKQDLFDICKYYRSVKHSPQTADNIKKALFDAARTLEMFPLIIPHYYKISLEKNK